MEIRGTFCFQTPLRARSATVGDKDPFERAFQRLWPRLARAATYCRGFARGPWSLLFGMNDDDVQIMTGPQVADLLQVPPWTLEEWRQTHSGPPWRRVGRHVRYVRREVLGWFESLDSHA
jgi:hypothetical protein